MFSIDSWIMKTCPIPVWPRALTQWLTTAAIPVVRPWWRKNAAHLLPVQKACCLAIACGARDKPGTDIYVFVQTVGFDLLVTKDAQEVRRFLAPNKGMVITNTRGDREGYTGVFSNSVHHTVLTDLEGEFVRVLDPMYRDGRYDSPGRKDKVRMEGNEVIALLPVISQDRMSRLYFLYSRDGGSVQKRGDSADSPALIDYRRQNGSLFNQTFKIKALLPFYWK